MSDLVSLRRRSLQRTHGDAGTPIDEHRSNVKVILDACSVEWCHAIRIHGVDINTGVEHLVDLSMEE